MCEEKRTWEISLPEFPHYLSAFATLENDTVSVVVKSTIHVNKEVKMPHSWSYDFVYTRPLQFVSDIRGFIIKRYGLKLAPMRYE